MSTIERELIEVCRHFHIDGEFHSYKIFTDGHINTTYLAVFVNKGRFHKYLVQGINVHVFKNPQQLMDNIVGVTKYLRAKIEESGGDANRETLTFLKADNDKYYLYHLGKCWRIYNFVDNSYTINQIENKEVFEKAGKSFGLFQKRLGGYPMDTLHETIKDFHNTPKRLEALVNSVKMDTAGRVSQVKEEIEFALSRKADAEIVLNLYKEGLIPLRVTHNDTKLNNILFDEKTGDSICVIDLDTIMPGFSLYDFGDSIRYGANTTREDDDDLDNVKVSLELFEAFTRGFLSACAKDLNETEIKHLAFSAKLMTFECGVRFLTDYLDGDIYFKTAYQEHNLVRARNQFKLVSEMEKHMGEMEAIVDRIYKEFV